MEGGAWALARELRSRAIADVLVVSDYVDLARLRGLVGAEWARIPALAYFHENQLTYPLSDGEERDLSHGFTNVLTCIAAEAVVFNSRHHQGTFEAAATEFLRALPRPAPRAEFAAKMADAFVVYPGIELDAIPLGVGGDGPLRVLFNQRQEHDKAPGDVLNAVAEAHERGANVELVLLGERSVGRDAAALARVAPILVHDGHAEDRAEYAQWLGRSDVVLSCARHEFYGIAVLEAVAAGTTPLLPRRLAYPEIFAESLHTHVFYDSHEELVASLLAVAGEPGALRGAAHRRRMREAAATHDAARAAEQLDALVEQLAR